VVVGLDNVTGLQTARILAARGVTVIGLAGDMRHYAARTRACTTILQADLLREEMIAALLRLGPQLDQPAALFPCTDLSVLLISRHRDRLAPYFTIALPDHDVVQMLMDKVGFLRHAQEKDLPIPGTVIIENRDDALRAARTLTYPVVLKPAIKSATWQDRTSLKAIPTQDGRELLAAYEEWAPWSEMFIAQEWVQGGVDSLYSCNAYFDVDSRPLVSFVARKLRQWPPDVGTSSLGEECRNDEVLDETMRLFGSIGYRGLAYLEMKRDARTGRHLIIEPNIGRPTGRSAIAERGGVELLYTAYCDMVGLPLPPAREQRYVGAKWIDDRRDFQSALHSVRRRELTATEWLRSVRGPTTHAVLSRTDPLPFLVELLHYGIKGIRVVGARLVPKVGRLRSAAPAQTSGAPERGAAVRLLRRSTTPATITTRMPATTPSTGGPPGSPGGAPSSPESAGGAAHQSA
jgi:predicted ATP-grasp superfamily ATP-dependent carboligase